MCIRFYAFNLEINKCSKSRFSDRINEIVSLSLSSNVLHCSRLNVCEHGIEPNLYGIAWKWLWRKKQRDMDDAIQPKNRKHRILLLNFICVVCYSCGLELVNSSISLSLCSTRPINIQRIHAYLQKPNIQIHFLSSIFLCVNISIGFRLNWLISFSIGFFFVSLKLFLLILI